MRSRANRSPQRGAPSKAPRTHSPSLQTHSKVSQTRNWVVRTAAEGVEEEEALEPARRVRQPSNQLPQAHAGNAREAADAGAFPWRHRWRPARPCSDHGPAPTAAFSPCPIRTGIPEIKQGLLLNPINRFTSSNQMICAHSLWLWCTQWPAAPNHSLFTSSFTLVEPREMERAKRT